MITTNSHLSTKIRTSANLLNKTEWNNQWAQLLAGNRISNDNGKFK